MIGTKQQLQVKNLTSCVGFSAPSPPYPNEPIGPSHTSQTTTLPTRTLPLPQPLLYKTHLHPLRPCHRPRRQTPGRLILKQPILIPMMHRTLNQHMRLARRAGHIQHIRFRKRCQRRDGSPGICLAADVRETRVGYIEAAVFVDDGDVGGLREVEGVAADGAFVGEGQEAGD
jgi:hypothetical protein